MIDPVGKPHFPNSNEIKSTKDILTPADFRLPNAIPPKATHKVTLPSFEMLDKAKELMKHPEVATVEVLLKEATSKELPLTDDVKKVLQTEVMMLLATTFTSHPGKE